MNIALILQELIFSCALHRIEPEIILCYLQRNNEALFLERNTDQGRDEIILQKDETEFTISLIQKFAGGANGKFSKLFLKNIIDYNSKLFLGYGKGNGKDSLIKATHQLIKDLSPILEMKPELIKLFKSGILSYQFSEDSFLQINPTLPDQQREATHLLKEVLDSEQISEHVIKNNLDLETESIFNPFDENVTEVYLLLSTDSKKKTNTTKGTNFISTKSRSD